MPDRFSFTLLTFTTFTFTVAVRPLSVCTPTVAVPAFTGVTRPESSTVATLALEDLKV